MNELLRGQRLLLPVIFSSLIFIGNLYTTAKAFILLVGLLSLGKAFRHKYFDQNFLMLLLLATVYFIISNIEEHNKSVTNYQLLYLPALVYAGGKWIGSNAPNSRSAAFAFISIGSMLASMAFAGVLFDVMQNGFLGGGRSIALPGLSDHEISATVLGGTLVVIVACGGVVFAGGRELSLFGRFIIFVLYLAGLFVAFRLGSRTLLVIGLASLFIGIIVNIRHYGLLRSAIFAGVAGIVIYLSLNSFDANIDLFNYFQDRADSDEYGVRTIGGRTERWGNAINLLLENPLGWALVADGYSHNFWLDAARNGGWPSLILAIAITLMAIKTLHHSTKQNKDSSVYVTTVICSTFGFIALFFVEPILDGFVLVFCAFCSLWGLARGLRLKNRLSKIV